MLYMRYRNIVRHFLSASLAFVGTGLSALYSPKLYGATKTESYRLTLTPYSSSFSNQASAPLLKLPGFYSLQNSFLNQDMVKNNSRPIFSRFEDAINGTLSDYYSTKDFAALKEELRELKKDMSDPRGTAETGYCDRYSAASLSPVIHDLLEKTKGLICDSILITGDEMKELITVLYQYHHLPEVAALGLKTPHDFKENKLAEDLYLINRLLSSELGINDLNPAEFSNFAVSQIKNNRGFIIDSDDGNGVFNHPVFAVERTDSEKIYDLLDGRIQLERVPLPILFADPDKMSEEDLETFHSLQMVEVTLHRFPTYLSKLTNSQKDQIFVDAWKASTKNIFGQVLPLNSEVIKHLLARRSLWIREKLYPLANSRAITLNKGFYFQLESLSLTAGQYSRFFASPGVKDLNYAYQILKFGDDEDPTSIHGVWLGYDWPDFVLQAEVPSLVEIQGGILGRPLKALFDLADRCQSFEIIANPLSKLVAVSGGKDIGKSNRKNLATELQAAKQYFSKSAFDALKAHPGK